MRCRGWRGGTAGEGGFKVSVVKRMTSRDLSTHRLRDGPQWIAGSVREKLEGEHKVVCQGGVTRQASARRPPYKQPHQPRTHPSPRPSPTCSAE